MADPTHDAATIPVVAILGIDAVLAARPATPVQLAHACLSAGYTEVYPASWGDELIAARSLGVVRDRGREPAILCACPFVAERLLSVGDDLEPFIVPLVSPPVAAALYLRAIYGEDGVHITYVGACPSGADPAIDLQLTPGELLDALRERDIGLSQQPRVFNSIIPPDRRRYYSLPGGAPTVEWLEREGGRRLMVLDGDDHATELAQHLISQTPVLVDAAPCMGCLCSGASGSPSVSVMRQLVANIEPPQAPSPVVDTSIALELSLTSPFALLRPEDERAPSPGESAEAIESDEAYVEVDIGVASPVDTAAADAQLEVAFEMTEAEVHIRTQEGVADLGEREVSPMVPWEEDLLSWNGHPVSDGERRGEAEQDEREPEPAMEPAPTVAIEGHDAEAGTVASEPEEPERHRVSENGARHGSRPRRATPASVRRLAPHTPVVRTEEGRTRPRAYFVQRRVAAAEGADAQMAGAGMTEELVSERVEEVIAPAAEPAIDDQALAERELPIDRSVEPAATTAVEPTPEAAAPAEAPLVEAPPADEASPIEQAPAVDEPPRVEETPAPRTTGTSYRSVVVPLPSDRPRPIPPPALKDRSPLAWALLAIAVVAISLIVIRLLTAEREVQRTERVTTVPVQQPLAPVPTVPDSVTVSADSASISADSAALLGADVPSTAPPDSGAVADSAGQRIPSAPPDTTAARPDSLAASGGAAPAPPVVRQPRTVAPRRRIVPRQAPLTPDQRRRRFDSLARIVDSLVPVPSPTRPSPPR
ncbi:MAG TPA: hypothetical protein VJ596_11575 [Gemmatimonadaceae bacterium]|nr:hypothetical protein [Gemmatimonadaceae bacterium]